MNPNASLAMELRQHPRMTYQGRPNWPPEWKGPYGPHHPLPRGEVGTLLRVDTPSSIVSAPHCIVVIQWHQSEYFGSLYFDDEGFMQKIVGLLGDCLGRPIAEIGDIDVPASS